MYLTQPTAIILLLVVIISSITTGICLRHWLGQGDGGRNAWLKPRQGSVLGLGLLVVGCWCIIHDHRPASQHMRSVVLAQAMQGQREAQAVLDTLERVGASPTLEHWEARAGARARPEPAVGVTTMNALDAKAPATRAQRHQLMERLAVGEPDRLSSRLGSSPIASAVENSDP